MEKCKLIDTWYFISYSKAECDAHNLNKFHCNALLAIVLAGCGPMGPGALQRIMSHFEELLLSGCQAVY